ncbi:hypothetical protein NPIL_60811 [Nephila pilipes]|uniref:Uncharacterized protein n=1 Tax=Nephila pilipes TaxID=299642 RepID=A0A8X6R4J8_NEPPI|nr:hypothetical protein NPIL_60811 [Nephila pilipes]
MIFEVCLHILQWALRAFAGFDLLYFIEVFLSELMMEFIDYATTEFLSGSVFDHCIILETTTDAAIVHSPTVEKTYEALDLKSKLVPRQQTTSLTETPYERKDPVATIPVVRSFFVWKVCESLDLPATFIPQETDTALSSKEFKVNKPVPVVYSVAVFELCKALELKAQLAHQ